MSEGRPASAVFDPRMIAALVTAGLVAFGLFMVLTAYAGDLRSNRDGRAHALSGSANGFKGIVRLIGLSGGKAQLVRSPADLGGEELLVVAAEPNTSPESLDALLRRRAGKATLIVLPKWAVAPDPRHPGWVKRTGTLPASTAQNILGNGKHLSVARSRASAVAAGREFLREYRAPLPELVQTISGDGITPLVTDGSKAVLARLDAGAHYVLSDPDLLNNLAMSDRTRAAAALALLDELNTTGATRVSFDLTLNGLGRQPNALKLAFEPPFLPLTLALTLAALLAGLHGAFRFGPAAQEQRAIAFGKGALVENSAGLLKLAQREQSAGGAYADLIREGAAWDSGAHLALQDAELDAYLDRLSAPDQPRLSDLVQQARLAEDRFDLLAAARALFQWKKDLIK